MRSLQRIGELGRYAYSQAGLFGRFVKPARNYVCSVDLKGTYDVFHEKFRHLSPFNGMVLRELGVFERIYDLDEASVTGQLIRELFHKHGSQFKATQNKSMPGFYLTPQLVAKIMYHLHTETLHTPEVKAEIVAKWRAVHKRNGSGVMTAKRVGKVIDLILAVKSEINVIYPEHMSENILTGYLVYRLESRGELINDYLLALQALLPEVGQPQQLQSIEAFTRNDAAEGKQILEAARPISSQVQLAQLMANYEKVIAYFIYCHALPRITERRYGFNGQEPVANCMEAVFQDVCNILLFNGEQFDLAVLPNTLTPNAVLRDFYELQEWKSNRVNDIVVAKAFGDMVSGHSFMRYCQADYELDPRVDNFIPLINYLFGSNAQNFVELSAQFSDERREVTFVQQKDDILVTITSANSSVLEFRIVINPGAHARLMVVDAMLRNVAKSNKYEYRFKQDNYTLNALEYLVGNASCGLMDLQYPQFIYSHFRAADLGVLMSYYVPRQSWEAERFFIWLAPKVHDYPDLIPMLKKFIELHQINVFDTIIAICCAAHISSLDVIKIIKSCAELGFSPAMQDEKGNTLLHYVDDALVMSYLLRVGVDPNSKNDHGATPLHRQIKCAHSVKELLERGANPDVEDNDGKKPLDYATDIEVRELLMQASATRAETPGFNRNI